MFGLTLGHVWGHVGSSLGLLWVMFGSLWVGSGATLGRVLANFGPGQGTIWDTSGQLFDIIDAKFVQKGFHRFYT